MSEEIGNLLELVTAGEWGNNQGTPGGIDTGVIRSANFTKDHQFNTKEIVTRSIEERKRQKKMLRKGDILIEKSGGSPDQPVGRVLFYDLKGEHTCSNFISILRPAQQVEAKFLYYSLCNLYERGVVKNYQQQTTGIINLQLGEYLRESIYLPPLPEQKKITEILSGIDKQIFAHQKQLDKNQRLIKGVLSRMLARIEEESRDSTRLIEDIFVETNTPETHDSETPLYSLTIESGLVPKPDRYVRDFLLTDKEKENYKLITKGVFAMNPMNLRWGAISAFHKESSAKISKYYTTFRARDNRASTRFYEFLFRSDQYLRLYERIATGSLIEKMRVHWSAFRKLEIPFPSPEEQKNFESLSSSLELANSGTQDLIGKLKVFRSAVASELLSGRKRVSV